MAMPRGVRRAWCATGGPRGLASDAIARPVVIPRSRLPAPVVWHDGEAWVLDRSYTYDDRGTLLTVKAGFRWDLSSVPRIFWPFVAPFELSVVASLFHDALYREGGDVQAMTTPPPTHYSRSDADRVFYDIMEKEGIGWTRRHVAWMAVRDFGWAAWGSD
jgi:Protein of unknown function (DUF1353)